MSTKLIDKFSKAEAAKSKARRRDKMVDRPNVVVIVADTFRRDHLGVYGNQRISTPHLDGFARESVVFDHHVVSSFPTMPARADILTGTFSYTHMGWEPLPRHLTTLPGALSESGYHTMGVVDTPFFIRNGFGYDRGFDDFIWVRGQGDDTRPHERSDARSTWRSEEDRMVARTVTQAERWLEKLDALGLRDNTIVRFTSDHGFYFGEHDYFGKADWVQDPEAEVSADS